MKLENEGDIMSNRIQSLKFMSAMFKGKEIFKPLNNFIDEKRVSCIRGNMWLISSFIQERAYDND